MSPPTLFEYETTFFERTDLHPADILCQSLPQKVYDPLIDTGNAFEYKARKTPRIAAAIQYHREAAGEHQLFPQH